MGSIEYMQGSDRQQGWRPVQTVDADPEADGALNTGAKPMVHMNTNDKMAIVIQEILEDKIYLDMSGNVQAQNNITTMSNITGTVFGNIGPMTTPSAAAAALTLRLI